MVKKAISDFRKQLNLSVSTAIITAFGILIALSWNTLITGYVNKISSYSPLQGQLISTIIVTIIAVTGIVITTRIFASKDEAKK